MKSFQVLLRSWCVAVTSLLVVPCATAGGLIDLLFPDRDLQTITVTDTTSAGKLRRQPTREHPLYYAAVSAGYTELGGIKAGEKRIARGVVDQTMLKILAKQGYLPAAPGQQPDIILEWTWGTLNYETFTSPDGFSYRWTNEGQLLRFLGGEKLGLVGRRDDPFPENSLASGLLFCTGDARNLLDAAHDDLFIAVISAYSAKLNGERRATLLWNTRISCPARGFWLPDALPAMLAIASPYVGRETSKPVWIRATERFKPDVQLGDMKLVEYLEKAQPTVKEVGPSS